jgi:hypothetical protein
MSSSSLKRLTSSPLTDRNTRASSRGGGSATRLGFGTVNWPERTFSMTSGADARIALILLT